MSVLDELRALDVLVRRASMRVVGTPEQEAMRALAEAVASGASLAVSPWVKAGSVLIVGRTVWFHSEAERDALLGSLAPV